MNSIRTLLTQPNVFSRSYDPAKDGRLLLVLNQLSMDIHKQTLRSPANVIVIHPRTLQARAAELEFVRIPGGGSDFKFEDAHAVGQIQNRWTVFVSEFLPESRVFLGLLVLDGLFLSYVPGRDGLPDVNTEYVPESCGKVRNFVWLEL